MRLPETRRSDVSENSDRSGGFDGQGPTQTANVKKKIPWSSHFFSFFDPQQLRVIPPRITAATSKAAARPALKQKCRCVCTALQEWGSVNPDANTARQSRYLTNAWKSVGQL